MPGRVDGAALEGVRAIFGGGVATDATLLDRFVTRADDAEDAFAALVDRHGPAVSRACQAILGEHQATRDAFQATFLVLARKAGTLQVRDSLGPWLLAVAVRVAASARTAEARRLKHLRRQGVPAARSDDDPSQRAEVVEVVREELARLPERLRAAVIACDLEGLGHEQAAHRLGWPVGTVKSRQARGRAALRGRLARRGVAPTIAAARLPGQVWPLARVSLVGPTARVASQVASGCLITSGASSASVTLMEGAMKAMILAKLGIFSTATLVAVVVAGGAFAMSRGGQDSDDRPAEVQQHKGTESAPTGDAAGGAVSPADRAARDALEPTFRELLDQLRSPDPTPIRPGTLPSARELAEARYEAADAMVDGLIRELVEPSSGPVIRHRPDKVELILMWLQRRRQARLILGGADSDRIAVLVEELGQLRRLEALCKELARGAGTPVTELDLIRVKYDRLGVEQELVQARGERLDHPPGAGSM